jgi:hypothetical protein
LKQIETTSARADPEKIGSWMRMAKQNKSVYDAGGVEFTIYETIKFTNSGPTRYWLLEDYSTGKRRLLNNKTKMAAQQRAKKIRSAMVKGQASRMSLSNGQWQDVCIALEIVRGALTGDSLASAIRSWAECITILGCNGTLLDAVNFYVVKHNPAGPKLKPTRLAEAAEFYHAFKVKSGVSATHCANIRCRLARLGKALPADVGLGDLTPGQLDTAVLALNIGQKTRNEYRLILSNLYDWAAK